MRYRVLSVLVLSLPAVLVFQGASTLHAAIKVASAATDARVWVAAGGVLLSCASLCIALALLRSLNPHRYVLAPRGSSDWLLTDQRRRYTCELRSISACASFLLLRVSQPDYRQPHRPEPSALLIFSDALSPAQWCQLRHCLVLDAGAPQPAS